MPPIVFVPGLLCTAEIFTPQIIALWPYGSVTVASTLEGNTMADIAAAILAAAPPRFALVGISMGGYICFEIMRQAPERVIKLALLDTSAQPDTPEQTAQRRAQLAQVQTGNFVELAGQALDVILHPAHQHDTTLHAINTRMAATIGFDGFARQSEAAITRVDSRPDLPAITVPTLVLVGDSDRLIPPAHSEEIAAAIPGAQLVVVPQCGHSSTIEQPDAVNRALIAWLNGQN